MLIVMMAVINGGNENYLTSLAFQFVEEYGFNFKCNKFIEVYAWIVTKKMNLLIIRVSKLMFLEDF